MRHIHIILLSLLFAVSPSMSAAPVSVPLTEGGLSFKSYDVNPDSRTSLLSGPIGFNSGLTVEFDIKIDRSRECFGYICRIDIDSSNSIDLLLTTPVKSFPYIALSDTFGSLVKICSDHLEDWNHITVRIKESPDGTIVFNTNDSQTYSFGTKSRNHHAVLLFGKNDCRNLATTDIAPMTIRNLTVSVAGKEPVNCPLFSEADLFKTNNIEYTVSNPSWVIDKNRFWKKSDSLRVNEKIFLAGDPDRGRFYFITSEKLFEYSVEQASFKKYLFKERLDTKHFTNDFLVTKEGRLAYFDMDSSSPVVVYFDTTSSAWESDIRRIRHSKYEHHNSFVNPIDSSFVQLFGYGYHLYLNDICIYKKGHASVDTLSIPPRYLSAVGVVDSLAYIMGGKGSPKGLQEFGTCVYSDLWKMNLKDYSVTKIGDFDNAEGEVAAANLDIEDDMIRGLFYSPNNYQTSLVLKEYNIKDGSIVERGDRIPYTFLDVESYAALYRIRETLYAITVQKESGSFVARIYSIELPVIDVMIPSKEKKSHVWIVLLVSSFMFVALALVVIRLVRKIRIRSNDAKDDIDFENTSRVYGTGVHLLNGFVVIDKEENDISVQFSPLLRRLLVMLILYTRINKSISNAEMKELLWYGKSDESYFNNRGVNLKKLRNALLQVDPDISIISEGGYWSISFPEGLCDFNEAMDVLETSKSVRRCVEVARLGTLLPDMRYDWLDHFTAAYTDKVISRLSEILSKGENISPESRIKIADALLIFDPIDEESIKAKCIALMELKHHGVARSEFDGFVARYESLMAEPFKESFAEFVKD